MSDASEMNKFLKQVRRAGWAVERTRKQHWKVTSPSGKPFFLPSTPSEYRSLQNCRSLLKRAGLDVTL